MPVWVLALALGVGSAFPSSESDSVARASGPPQNVSIERVDPPNWWIGHSVDRIQLAVRGTGLSNGELAVSSPGVRVLEQRVSASGTTLFAELEISTEAAPGAVALEIGSASGPVMVPFRLDARRPETGRYQGLSPDDVIYLVMPDRFADGDLANNRPDESRPVDRSAPFGYHGGDLTGLRERLTYLRDLGITAIWLNPIYDNSDRRTDYHGYGATDFYDVDEHLGTLEEFRLLVDEAHALGLKVVQDQVANHTGAEHVWTSDYPTPTWYNGTPANHLNNIYDIPSVVEPTAAESRRRATLEGWFANSLPDLNQNDPEAARYLIQNSIWWIESTGIDAIRQDTLPYVPRTYWAAWMTAIKAEYPEFTVIGEVFNGDPNNVAFFQGGAVRYDGVDSEVDTVFDFPLYFKIIEVFASRYSMKNLRDAMAQDHLYPDASLLVPFLGNHDTPRFTTRTGGDTRQLRLAQTFLLTTRGIPQLYYGDEIGMPGEEDPDNRRDFPGGFPADPKNAFTAQGRSRKQRRVFDHVSRLLQARSAIPGLRGLETTFLAAELNLLAYVRSSGESRALVVFNNGPTTLKPTLPLDGAFGDGTRLRDALGSRLQGTVVAGTLKIKIKPHSAVILVPERPAQ